MFTIELKNHQFGYVSHYGSFTNLVDAQAAADRVSQSSGLPVSFRAIPTPSDITPKPLHPSYLAD